MTKLRGLDPSVRPLWAIALVLLMLGPGAGAAAEPQASNRFNVLLICIDDLRPELGCYGAAAAQSPRLDRFADSAVVFNRHYVQVPTCGSSRYALLTGRSPAASGVTGGNAAFYRGKSALLAEQQPGAQSLPELFRRSGYHTACLGKISHTPDGRVYEYNGSGDGRHEVPHAWDSLPTPFGEWKRGWGIFFAYAGGKHREDGQGHRELMEFVAERDEDLPDGLLAQTAIKQLQQFKTQEKPFFLGLGFIKPHLPFVAPRQDWEALADTPITPPAHPQKPDSRFWHRSGEFYHYDFPFEKSRPLSEEATLQTRRAYLACVRYVDRQVGKVLDELQRLDLADNTVVVVWDDHGWHLGEQQVWGKHTPLERALRSVLMIRVPGRSKSGLKTNALAETIDLYPTLVDVCQPQFTQTHHPLDGRSLTPVLTGDKLAVREAAVSYWNQARSIRTATHRLVYLPGDKQPHYELCDLSADLDSTTNLAEAQPELVTELLQAAEASR